MILSYLIKKNIHLININTHQALFLKDIFILKSTLYTIFHIKDNYQHI